MELFPLLLSLCMGVALAAACGFRVFVPLLAVSLAVRWGGLHVGDSLSWVGSDAAFLCLTVATVAEIAAYYIPLVDHALDVVSTPLALLAGTFLMSGMVGELPGYLQWGIAIVGGAGTAGLVKAGSASLRGASTATTATLANPLVATVENILAIVGSVMAVVLPLLAALGCVLMAWLFWRIFRRFRHGSAPCE